MALQGKGAKPASILSRLRAAYDPKVRALDKKSDLLRRFVYRPISFPLSVPFARLGLSANQITILRMVLLAIVWALFSIGYYWSAVVAGFLYVIDQFLDYVDGNIARLRGATYSGYYLDEVSDMFSRALTPLAISFGLYFRPDLLMIELGDKLNPAGILIVGATAGLARSLRAYVGSEFHYAELLQQSELGRKSQSEINPQSDNESEIPNVTKKKNAINIGYIYRNCVSFSIFLLPLFALFDVLSLFVCFMFLARVVVLPIDLFDHLARAGRELDD